MKYIFCPVCGSRKLDLKETKIICLDCGFSIYQDPVPGASAIPIKNNKALLAIRKNEPFKGTYDVIGGFINPGESAEEAAIRETKEETGLDVKVIRLLGNYPDTYGDADKPILVFQFIVEITGGEIEASDDVSELVWVDIKDIPNLKNIGFESVKKTLADLYKLNPPFGRGAEN